MYWLVGILGVALAIAPFLFGYSNNVTALWTSLILGVIVAAVSFYKILSHNGGRWEYPVAAIMGLFAVFAPFLLGFSTLTTAMWASVILGALIALIAGYLGFFARPQM